MPPRAERPLPAAPATKTADDLKAILREMTSKNAAQKQKAQDHHQQSLKGTLSNVLEKKETPPAPPHPASSPPPEQKPRPFEIPEAELRNILKGDE